MNTTVSTEKLAAMMLDFVHQMNMEPTELLNALAWATAIESMPGSLNKKLEVLTKVLTLGIPALYP